LKSKEKKCGLWKRLWITGRRSDTTCS
jgi:hypothetical protein